MEEIVLKAQPRTVTGKQVKVLRRQGELPAVIYGHGVTPVLISLNLHDISRIMPSITSSHLVTVDVNGARHTVLVRERQRDPVTGYLIHLDFQEVSMTEKLRASVVVELVGESPAVKDFNGVLVTGLEALQVESLPRDLPERIQIDVSSLRQVGDVIHVKDVPVPAAVEVLDNPEELVVLVTAGQASEEVVEPEAAEPEVIERGKKEEEEF